MRERENDCLRRKCIFLSRNLRRLLWENDVISQRIKVERGHSRHNTRNRNANYSRVSFWVSWVHTKRKQGGQKRWFNRHRNQGMQRKVWNIHDGHHPCRNPDARERRGGNSGIDKLWQMCVSSGMITWQ